MNGSDWLETDSGSGLSGHMIEGKTSISRRTFNMHLLCLTCRMLIEKKMFCLYFFILALLWGISY